MAAPRTPSSGAPQCPKISAQFSTMLQTTPANVAQSTIPARSSADRKLFRPMIRSAGTIPAPAMRR